MHGASTHGHDRTDVTAGEHRRGHRDATEVMRRVGLTVGQQPKTPRCPGADLRTAEQIGDRVWLVPLLLGQRLEVLVEHGVALVQNGA
jgi:hypothetical protein